MYWSLAVVFKKQEISQQVVTRMQDLAYEFWKIFRGWYPRTLTAGGGDPLPHLTPSSRGASARVLGPKPWSPQLFSRGCAPESVEKSRRPMLQQKWEDLSLSKSKWSDESVEKSRRPMLHQQKWEDLSLSKSKWSDESVEKSRRPMLQQKWEDLSLSKSKWSDAADVLCRHDTMETNE